MELLTRKQREIQQRERQILALARPILVREGYQSLSMERLASEMEYAKGTLYNHFPNKEEIVAALALESLQLRRTMFEVASVITPSSRERMIAIGVCCDLYATEYAIHFAVEQMLRNAVIWEKSSEIRRDLILQCEHRAVGIVAGVVRDGIANGDLIVPHNMTAEEFAFGFWSLLYGSRAIIESSPSLPDIGINNPETCIHIHGCALMNGFQWQPLMTYETTEELMQSFSKTIVARVEAMNSTT